MFGFKKDFDEVYSEVLKISIQLMFGFKYYYLLKCNLLFLYFNTTYVWVQDVLVKTGAVGEFNFNTTYVWVQVVYNLVLKLTLFHFNTTYVWVQVF